MSWARFVAVGEDVFEVGRVLAQSEDEADAKLVMDDLKDAPFVVVWSGRGANRAWGIALRGRLVCSTRGTDWPASVIADALNATPQTAEDKVA